MPGRNLGRSMSCRRNSTLTPLSSLDGSVSASPRGEHETVPAPCVAAWPERPASETDQRGEYTPFQTGREDPNFTRILEAERQIPTVFCNAQHAISIPHYSRSWWTYGE